MVFLVSSYTYLPLFFILIFASGGISSGSSSLASPNTAATELEGLFNAGCAVVVLFYNRDLEHSYYQVCFSNIKYLHLLCSALFTF